MGGDDNEDDDGGGGGRGATDDDDNHERNNSVFIDGKPPTIDSFVEYHFYLDPADSNETAEEEEKEELIRLKAMCLQMSEVALELGRDYLWEVEPFQLKIKKRDRNVGKNGFADRERKTKKREKRSDHPHVWGRQLLGDSIDDEWLSTRIVFELTKLFPNVTATLEDNDGQFLLAEAAYQIPEWLDPENAINRVFIRGGKLHIVPIPTSPSDFLLLPHSTSITLSEALQIVRTAHVNTVALDDVQKTLFDRIEDSTGFRERSTHYTRAWLPSLVACVFHSCPQLISSAVIAFCEKDVLANSNKILARMTKFGHNGDDLGNLHRNPDGKVTQNDPVSVTWKMVRFTRSLFAKLAAQPYHPPKNCSWLPPLPSTKLMEAEHRWAMVGLKLTAGLELLYATSNASKEKIPVYSAIDKGDYKFELDKEWLAIRSTCERANHSHWKAEEERRAKAFYLCATFPSRYTLHDYLSPATTINKILSEAAVTPSYELSNDSDDSWLYVSPEDVDTRLTKAEKEIARYLKEDRDREEKVKRAEEEENIHQRSNKDGDHEDEDDKETEKMKEMDEMVDNMKRFLGVLASLDGAELPSDQNDVDDDDSKEGVDLRTTKLTETLARMLSYKNEMSDTDGDDEDEEAEMKQLMREMDAELATTKIAQSFQQAQTHQENSGGNDDDDDKGVDLNLNLVKNILDSFEAQGGAPGPFSNLFGAIKQEEQRQRRLP